jgi:tetratricopeptide (TPR) repeat protein
MAYVRRRGNQVLIVHGHRDPESGKVVQRTLFALYSREEAKRLLGPGKREFRALLREQFPQLTLNWKRIEREIESLIGVLPEVYETRGGEAFAGEFKEALAAFARQLILASPEDRPEGAEALRVHRQQLAFLRQVIDSALSSIDRKPERPEERGRDFHWRFAMYGNEVPPGVEETATALYEKGRLDEAEAAFRLLVDAFDHYAEGHNFLGCIAYNRGNLPQAIEHYRKAATLGRNLFPKRLARSRYWSDYSTRPYMRGLQNLAMSLVAARRYDEALVVCDRLERECDDGTTADSHRAAIHLNTGLWEAAAETSERLRGLDASESFVSAFARAELEQWREALESFLHAALNHPGTARMLFGTRKMKPRTSDDVRDHNIGVSLLRSHSGYLGERRSPRSRSFFRSLVRDPRVAKLINEIETVRKRWFEERPADRALYDRMHEMQTLDFARQQARELSDLYPATPITTAGRH